MSTFQKTTRRIAATAAVSGIVAIAALTGAGTAAAAADTNPADAPPGYAGPFATCNGESYARISVPGTSGYVDVWKDYAGSGTFCAKTFDNLGGDHHMEIILQRDDWTTRWYDSGTYSTYAGGIYVSGANTHCTKLYGEITVNGQAHTTGWLLVC